MNFSANSRHVFKSALAAESFDVLVIGGGITGAGIALDASSRGLKIALIEKSDFAYGTSSRSTKLIHGGLRYLKQLEFALVKEVGSERAIVHRLAPHLVVPEKMLLPLYEEKGLGYWMASIGLKIYDWLAGVKPEDQRKMLTRLQTLGAEPLLGREGVKGGAIYAEYRTDDARLTIEIAKAAHLKGATMLNYCKALDFEYADNHVVGVVAMDMIDGSRFAIRAKSVVNATGPWVDDLRTINRSKDTKSLHLTKGVHIVVPFHRMAVRQAIYFDVPDGRMIFAIPRGRVTYIGTTDTDYKGNQDEVYATHEDARYLIAAVNETFPSVHLTVADIESSWAGLRPLIHEDGKSASELSRKDEIFESPSGLISIAGGKLTGYRKMAERVVDLLISRLFEDRMLPPCSTEKILLAGAGLKDTAAVRQYSDSMAVRVGSLGLKGDHVSYLIHLYGKQADEIVELAMLRKDDDPEINLAIAEWHFALEHEMAVRAVDFFVRRTGLVYFNMHRLMKIKDPLLHVMAKDLGWDEKRQQEESGLVDEMISLTLNFRE